MNFWTLLYIVYIYICMCVHYLHIHLWAYFTSTKIWMYVTHICSHTHFRFECLMTVSFYLMPDRNTLQVLLALFFLKESFSQHSSSSFNIIYWWLSQNLPDQLHGEDSLEWRRVMVAFHSSQSKVAFPCCRLFGLFQTILAFWWVSLCSSFSAFWNQNGCR